MIDFLSNVLRALPILSLFLLIAAIKTKRERRVEQLATAAMSVIYFLVALIILYRFNDFVFSVLETVGDYLPLGALRQGSLQVYLLENLLVLLVFAGLKLVTLPIFRRIVNRWRDTIQDWVENIYEYDPQEDAWFFSPRLGNLRRYLKILYWTSVVLTVLFSAVYFTIPQWPGFAGIAFPALATLVVGEFFFAYDGITKQEYGKQIDGEEDSAFRIANYDPLRDVLASTFPDRTLSSDRHLASRAALDSGFRIGQLGRSDHEGERLAGAYFSRLRQSRKDVDVNLLETCVDLLQRKSVLVNNPFYLDLGPYLILPAYHTLLRSRRVLVVAGRDSLASDLTEWITDGLEDITGIPDLWNVEILTTKSPANVHVAVLAFADVHNVELMRNNSDFLKDVDLVVVAEPSKMMATGQLGLSLLISMCGGRHRPVFAAFDGNHDGLVDALSHLLKTNLTEVVASSLPQGASAEVVWCTEGEHMHTEILPRVSRYLGMGTEIGAVALKYQVPRFQWIGGDSFPVIDMKWIAEQYYAQINAFSDLDLSQDALRDAFIAVANPWALPQEENYFLVVEDEALNAFEAIRKYSTRATMSGFVNLLSDEYLLRDYMVDNRELFSADPKAIPSIVPDFARTERNLALKMIMRMIWSEVTEADIAHEFELIGQGVPVASTALVGSDGFEMESAVVAKLRALMIEHTNVANPGIAQLSGFERRRRFEDSAEPLFRIQEAPDLQGVIQALQPAYFYVEDELGGVNRIGSLLFDHVYQAVLPGQFVTYAGKYYEVQSIATDDVRSGVVLRRAADHIRDRRSYRQWRTFKISDIVESSAIGAITDRAGIVMRRVDASIQVNCHGYFELASRADLDSARPIRVEGIPVRTYSNKSLLEIRLPDITANDRKTITLLLNEMFVSVYPNAHPYVIALTDDEDGEYGYLLTELTGSIDPACIYVVEDSMVDLGLTVSVERNWDRFMEIIADYLTWYLLPPEQKDVGAPGPKPAPKEVQIPEVPQPLRKTSWVARLRDRLTWWKSSEDGQSDESAPADIGKASEEPTTPEPEVVADAGSDTDDESGVVEGEPGGSEEGSVDLTEIEAQDAAVPVTNGEPGPADAQHMETGEADDAGGDAGDEGDSTDENVKSG